MQTTQTNNTTNMQFIGINNYAKGRAHALNRTFDQLVEEIQTNWEKGVSKESGVLIVPINPDFVKGEVCTLKGGETLTATFEARKGVNELPRKGVKGHHTLTPDPVKSADIILYSREKLGKDASTEADWEVVTFRGMGDPDQPQALDSLLYNLFGGSGGTEVAANKTAEEKLQMIRASWSEWKDKVILDAPPKVDNTDATPEAIEVMLKASGTWDIMEGLLAAVPTEAIRLQTKKLIIEAYRSYTASEMADMTNFYLSPTGKAMAAKAPKVLENMANILQTLKDNPQL